MSEIMLNHLIDKCSNQIPFFPSRGHLLEKLDPALVVGSTHPLFFFALEPLLPFTMLPLTLFGHLLDVACKNRQRGNEVSETILDALLFPVLPRVARIYFA